MDDEPINLSPTRFADLEGWAEDDHAAAFRALLRSCAANSKSPHAADALAPGASSHAARAFFEDRFLPRLIADSARPGFVTVQARDRRVLRARRARSGARLSPAQRPDYARARDGARPLQRPHHRLPAGRRRPSSLLRARRDLGRRAFGAGLELLYLKDMVELFYMQVQGSGRVHLKEGGAVRLGYSGKNGHPYTSIGRLLIERGAIAPDAMSMAAVKAWLRADETRGQALMEQNRSYVFFRELDAEGATARAGREASRQGRSLAVDTAYRHLTAGLRHGSRS